MSKYGKKISMLIATIISSISFISFFTFVLLLMYKGVDDMTAGYYIFSYVFMATTYLALTINTFIVYFKVSKIDYLWGALITTPISIGVFVYLTYWYRSGLKAKNEKEVLYIYYASRLTTILDDKKIMDKLSDDVKENIKSFEKMKDVNALKIHEANYYISKELVDSGVLKNKEIKLNDLLIISSNV